MRQRDFQTRITGLFRRIDKKFCFLSGNNIFAKHKLQLTEGRNLKLWGETSMPVWFQFFFVFRMQNNCENSSDNNKNDAKQ